MTLRQWLLERNQEIAKNGLYSNMRIKEFVLATVQFPSQNVLIYLGGQVNQQQNMNIFKQIVVGVNNIHSQGLIHRDLKVNVLKCSKPLLGVGSDIYLSFPTYFTSPAIYS